MSYNNEVFRVLQSIDESIVYAVDFISQTHVLVVESADVQVYDSAGDDVSDYMVNNVTFEDNRVQFQLFGGEDRKSYTVNVQATMTTGEVYSATGTLLTKAQP